MKKILSILLIIAMLLPCALAENGIQGDFAAGGSQLYYVTVNDELNTVSKEGGELVKVTGAEAVQEVVTIDDTAYFISEANGISSIMKTAEDGAHTIVNAVGQKLTHIGTCSGKLFVLIDGKLNRVDTETGALTLISEEPMESYAIADSYVYFVSTTDKIPYEKESLVGAGTLKREAGCLYKLSLLTNEVTPVLKVGISDIKCGNGCLYFHNLSDNYVMGSGNSEWLEGKVYRFDIATEELSAITTGYDWGFFPVSNGVVVYTMNDISLIQKDGGAKVQLMMPEIYTSIAADGDTLIVYERTDAKLTLLSIDGTAPVTLVGTSDLPTVEGLDTIPEIGTDDDEKAAGTETQKESVSAADDPWGVFTTESGSDSKDTSSSSSKSSSSKSSSSKSSSSKSSSSSGKKSNSYIFPNSATKKLTKKEILKVDKNKWAYGRNEILARHGYKFKNSTYANYFAKQSWYKAGGYKQSDVNSIEWYNMDLLKQMEKEYGVGSGASSSSKKEESKEKAVGKVKATGGNTNIRKSYSTSAAKVGLLKKGQIAEYLGSTKKDSRGVKWYKIRYDGVTGWVSSKYTKLKKNK